MTTPATGRSDAARPRILLSAFACDPRTGSEPYVGWNWATMLSDEFDVQVLTRRYSQDLIGSDPLTRKVTFHYFDLPFCAARNHHWRFIKLYYLLWQCCVLPMVLRLHARQGYAIIQHVTYNNLDVPGLLWLCPRIRFVWGPVGGGQTAPSSLKSVYGRHWWKENLRRLLKASARYNPIIIAAVRRASLIFFANEETASRLAGLPRRALPLLETAISDTAGPARDAQRAPGPVRVLWLSHVFPRKGLALALDAFIDAHARLPAGLDIELTVIGDGAGLEEARVRAAASKATASIRMLGAVPHAAVQEHMRQADIFLFTSVQDTSGNVVLEAMRGELPVIALNHQGAKVLLARGGGLLVDIGSYEETVSHLGTAILRLAADEQARTELGRQARREVLAHQTWAAKGRRVVAVYKDMLGLSEPEALPGKDTSTAGVGLAASLQSDET